ncbi:SRPBCC domain-containing protein [Kribbella sp. NPDC026611]|uniref:SRPBCC domain-containing protein n=1 Tax=Kribbella sp. NPDC026611 TaxID=3154911 RepID=UPI0033C68440
MSEFDPELDLRVERVIRAPRERVWAAWTEPGKFARWWVPAPTVCRVERLEVRAGGGIVTWMSEDGQTFEPHLDASFLLVEELERLVWTNAINSSWRPVEPEPFVMTAEVVFADHPEGTDYRIVVRHGSAVQRARHEEMGFADGWGSVTKQLAAVAEGEL